MAPRILLFGLMIAGLTSCATYRTGQTPDDVYYSPAKEGASYVQVDRDEDDRLTYNERNLEDRRLRQQIRDSRFRTFNDDIYWNSPRYNSWGWNTWNNPYNTWGWNNNYGMNYGWGWNHGFNNNYWGFNNYYNPNYICIPGGNNLIVISGPGAPKNSSGIRYSSPIQRFVNSGTNYNTGKSSGGSSSRYFGTTNSNNGTRRTGFFGGGNTNSGNWNQGNSSSGNRTFGNSSNSSSNSGGSSRTFSNSGGSSGGSSNSGGTKTSSGRRN
ncbi:MAG: hypothetical protein K2Q24_11790 [Chitinophagaceae bacterium]|jgi:hypothetical protein|nr:hypothetical protein [Chitinophagaceae bacterium]